MSIRVVHCKKEQFDVFIGRGSKWGNPFSWRPSQFNIIPCASREEAIEKYRDYILDSPDLVAALPELRDKVLGCYCAPLACHGNVLAELVGLFT